MSRRVLAAILVVTALAVAAFGIPLGVAVRRLYRDEALVRLEREATAATTELPRSVTGHLREAIELPRRRGNIVVGVYDALGRRVAGHGPRHADRAVSQARRRQVIDGETGNTLVVAVPVTSNERVVAIVRAAQPQEDVQRMVRRAWLLMAALGALVVGLAALLALTLARQLARPVLSLAGAASRLGDGDFTARAGRSGIAELDRVAVALDSTADRLGELLARERAFSADASHQLRTPLTGLRMALETALTEPGRDRERVVSDALAQADRLEATIEDLLALARDQAPDRGPLDLRAVLDDVDRAWRPVLSRDGRTLEVTSDDDLLPVTASAAAVRQVLEVLVANAAEHGAGTVHVRVREAIGGVALEVHDHGPGITGDQETVFRRREGSNPGRGIGLALARSLAEAEGGKLLLRSNGAGPTFTMFFSSSGEEVHSTSATR